MKELKIEAIIENIPVVTEFIDKELEGINCPLKAQSKIDIAIDEIVGNIARYAYAPETGFVTVRLEISKEPAMIRLPFIDSGVPYDPLAKGDPDVALAAEEREIGGLGIFMVKKAMDSVAYEYRDGKNVLMLTKNL